MENRIYSRNFSDDQLKAIDAVGENTLVSAGAGSGKTSVLTERIYQLAKEQNTLDNFLVLTFTNLAASEMKDRTRNLLFDDEATKHLASEVDNAHIETFDSFSLYLVKKYFYVLGISKDISIVDNSILTIKRQNILDELFENEANENNPELVALISQYSIKSNDRVKKMVIELLKKANGKINQYEYIEKLAKNYFSDEHIDSLINELFNNKLEVLKIMKDKANGLVDSEYQIEVLDFIDKLLGSKNLDELRAQIEEDFPKLKTKKGEEHPDKQLRAELSGIYSDYIKIKKGSREGDFGSTADIKAQFEETKPFITKICDLAINVEKQLDEFKQEKRAYSFSDISRFVIKLLDNKDIVNEIAGSFKYIMIDEYQDTNDIQDYVISKISNNNVYMVGDIKQSIYRFRGAECTLFQEKYEQYKKHNGGQEIDLNTSYRSRQEVVDFVNDVFGDLMIKAYNPIDYSNGHTFKRGLKVYDEHKDENAYKPEVYRYSYEKAAEMPHKEGNIIASDILKKIDEKYEIYDDKNKEFRPCTYKDFAIIVDRTAFFYTFQQIFSKRGIPLNAKGKEKLFNSDIAVLVKNLVKMLYLSLNNQYDVEYRKAFMSVARSFVFNYKDDKLHQIVSNKQELTEPFVQQMELKKESLRFASIKSILEWLYSQYHIYEHISKIANYYANAHKLEQLLSIASDMDALGYTLKDFVQYFNDMEATDLDVDYRDQDNPEDSVTLITIHGSKGLEYPITYFPGLRKEFKRDDSGTFLISDKYGISLPLVVNNFPSIVNTLTKIEEEKLDFAEKIRLLYVAITRCREKIIIIDGENDKGSNKLFGYETNSLSKLLSLSSHMSNYDSTYSLNDLTAKDKNNNKEVPPIVIKSINIPAKEIIHSRASKEVDEIVNESVLDFGSEVHSYLQTMNLENDDLSYISNKRIRRYVANVKDSVLFKEIKNSQVRHEFRFFDETNNIEGYIDALIIKDNEIDIVDFKLKNIADEEYDKQLRTYKRYVSQITKLPIKMYLIAAITGEIREVIDE